MNNIIMGCAVVIACLIEDNFEPCFTYKVSAEAVLRMLMKNPINIF